ncbi:MAG: bile acid:sodium symporter [Bacteroides sp. SM23_62_1]|nr:MAG: bile acid:sodium symporter [Bacteroides sp. SM23_62_1]
MNTRNTLLRISIGLSFISLGAFLIFLFLHKPSFTGPLLTFFFIFLAIGFQVSDKLRKFAYTIWIFAAVTVSMTYPHLFRQIGDFDLKKLIVPLLQIIMFGMGSQLSIKNFADVIRMPRGVLVGITCQFTIMPVIGFTIAKTFGFPAEVAAGIILVGSSPSGLASNVMSFIARANLALSVTLTAVATLMAPLVTPALMKLLAGQFVPVDFWGMMLDIINIVILPIVAGLIFHAVGYGTSGSRSIIIQAFSYIAIIGLKNLIGYYTQDISSEQLLISLLKDIAWFSILPIIGAVLFKYLARGRKDWLDKAMSLLSMLGIGIIITIITAAGRDSLMTIGLVLILACLIHNLTGYFLGYWFCRLIRMDEQSCRTIALEVGMQNGGLASGIALEMGKVTTVGLAPAVFGPMMNITGSSLATWWRGKGEGAKECKSEGAKG